MPSRLRFPGLAIAALACLVLPCLTGCGDPANDEVGPGGPAARRVAKPLPRAGRVEAVVVERPGPGRAIVEARWWTDDPEARPVTLELRLPEDDAWLVSGARTRALSGTEETGVRRFEIEYRPGQPLDAVIRLHHEAEPGRGAGPVREAYVRIAK